MFTAQWGRSGPAGARAGTACAKLDSQCRLGRCAWRNRARLCPSLPFVFGNGPAASGDSRAGHDAADSDGHAPLCARPWPCDAASLPCRPTWRAMDHGGARGVCAAGVLGSRPALGTSPGARYVSCSKAQLHVASCRGPSIKIPRCCGGGRLRGAAGGRLRGAPGASAPVRDGGHGAASDGPSGRWSGCGAYPSPARHGEIGRHSAASASQAT
jgi:hypothetical protein